MENMIRLCTNTVILVADQNVMFTEWEKPTPSLKTPKAFFSNSNILRIPTLQNSIRVSSLLTASL